MIEDEVTITGDIKEGKRIRTAVMAAVLSLALTLSFVPATSAHARTYPNAAARDTTWYSDDAPAFTISTPQQLAGLAYLVSVRNKTFEGKTVTLAADVDLSAVCGGEVSWLPIGWGYSTGTAFKGTFDGGGHTISNLWIDDSGECNALFGKVYGATIRNFTVTGTVYGSEYVAGVISQCSDSDLSYLTNECTVDAVKYNQGTAHEGRAAGVVCYVASAYPTANRTFERLVNKGKVTSTSYYTAGVVGFLYSDNKTTVKDCSNEADVYAYSARYGLDDAGKAVGGVVGATAGAYGTYEFSGLVNTGDVGSDNLVSAGGDVGYFGGVGSSITHSENMGSVSGPNNTGGNVGYIGSGGGSKAANLLNTGAVSGAQAGGVIGASSGSAGQAFADNFTLDVAAGAYGSSVPAHNDDTVVSADVMKTQRFLDLLDGGALRYSIVAGDNGGLPILAWTNPLAVPGKGGIVDDDADADETDKNTDAEKDGDSKEKDGDRKFPKGGDKTDGSRQDGNQTGRGGEDPSQYENAGNPDDGITPAQLIDEPVDADAEKDGDGKEKDADAEKDSGSTDGSRQDGNQTGRGGEDPSQYENAGNPDDGITPAQFIDEPIDPAGDAAVAEADGSASEEVSESGGEAEEPKPESEEEPESVEAEEPEPEEADTQGKVREMVELAAVDPVTAYDYDHGVPPVVAAISGGATGAFALLGFAYENIAFTRSGGGWRRRLQA